MLKVDTRNNNIIRELNIIYYDKYVFSYSYIKLPDKYRIPTVEAAELSVEESQDNGDVESAEPDLQKKKKKKEKVGFRDRKVY